MAGVVTAPARRGRSRSRASALSGPLLTLAFAAALVAIALAGSGGLQLEQETRVEIWVDIAAGLLCAAGVLAALPARRPWGFVTLGLFAALTVLTGLSIGWAIAPSGAWIEVNRTLSGFAVMATGVALVRLAPGRWRALLGGVLLASLVVSGYALLTKVFPATLAPDETYARLRDPFGYWNAVGLMAALGVPPAVWLGARRDGHGGLAALAYPALGVLFVAILLAYSRGSLLAVVIGMAAWFALVPLRLRGATVLLPTILLSALLGFWAFHQDGLSKDRMEILVRTDSGHELGIGLAALLVLLLLTGLLTTFIRDGRVWPQRTRRAWGTAILVTLALVPFVFAGALALSHRGLGGTVSHAWKSLTDPNANTPPNDPSRLTAIGSVRSRYWRDAITIFRARPVAGVGAGGYATARLRFRKDNLDVLHAHGYLVQTASDLGIIGLVLTLSLLAAWLAAAVRTTGPWRGPGARPPTPERAGMLTLGAIVVVFGVHSLIDWTWFVPGTRAVALLCAGWIAARGPTTEVLGAGGPFGAAARLRAGIHSPARVTCAVLVLLVAAAAAWSASRPQHAADQTDAALAALADGDSASALRLAEQATRTDPLSVDALFTLSQIQTAARDRAAAAATLQRAVQLQPANADTWNQLALYDLDSGAGPRAALRDVAPALFLNPRSATAQSIYLEAYRRSHAARAKATKAKAGKGR